MDGEATGTGGQAGVGDAKRSSEYAWRRSSATEPLHLDTPQRTPRCATSRLTVTSTVRRGHARAALQDLEAVFLSRACSGTVAVVPQTQLDLRQSGNATAGGTVIVDFEVARCAKNSPSPHRMAIDRHGAERVEVVSGAGQPASRRRPRGGGGTQGPTGTDAGSAGRTGGAYDNRQYARGRMRCGPNGRQQRTGDNQTLEAPVFKSATETASAAHRPRLLRRPRFLQRRAHVRGQLLRTPVRGQAPCPRA